MADNGKEAIIRKSTFIILVIAVIVLHCCYMIISLFAKIFLLPLILLGVIVLIIILIGSFRKGVVRFRINETTRKKLYEVFEESKKLLNIFFDYFDNSFIIIQAVFTKDKDFNEKDLDSDLAFISEHYQEYISSKKSEMQTKEDNNYDPVTLLPKIDGFLSNAQSFVAMVKSIETEMFNDIFKRLETYEKKEKFNKLVIEYRYYSEITYDFIDSIIHEISSTTKPLSEEIFTIKKVINAFLKNVLGWKAELTDNRNAKNFDSIIKQYNDQNMEFNNFFGSIQDGYGKLNKNLVHIHDMFENVYLNTHAIKDISENINILSINASIESTRVGMQGKGFKLISGEIKKLAQMSQVCTQNITTLIRNTNNLVKNTLNVFEAECTNTIESMNRQKNQFNVFYNALQCYNEDFNRIFTQVSDVTTSINTHIDKLNPVFQLHEISVQEMNNLNIMIENFLENNKEMIDGIIQSTDLKKRNLILKNLFEFIQEKTTTNMEAKVLERIITRYNMEGEFTVRKNDVNIELF